MATQSYDLVVIGSGPGGYVGAIRASQLGLKVALVEKSIHLGGTCLNVGCIPTKSLLESAKTYEKFQHADDLGFNTGKLSFDWSKIMNRKEGIVGDQRKGLRFLMKKNKIDTFEGFGKLLSKTEVSIKGSDGKESKISTKNVLLATGSVVTELPFAPSNGRNILTSDSVLFIDHVPKTMAVVGGGVVGTEFACLFAKFGTKVTIIEMAPQILPFEDKDTVKELVKHLKKDGISIETKAKLTKVEDKGDHCMLTTEGEKPRKFDKVLMSVGRSPNTKNIGLETVGISVNQRGFIEANEQYKTNVDNIYAIGDIITTPMLAHTASAEAMIAAEAIAGHKTEAINYETNPSAVYTMPEIASIGKTEDQLKEAKIDYKAAKVPFMPNAKAKIEGHPEGFVKLLFDPKYGEILGVHIVGAKATEMISEFVVAKVLESTIHEIGHSIHPHPTISEVSMEAAHAAIGGAIHM